MTNTENNRTVHEGRNVKRIREMLGIKQEALAFELGDDWTQKKVSLLESKETIDDALLQQVAAVLKVPVEAIKNFSEEAAINIIANTVTNYDNGALFSYKPHINPLDKLIEAYEENKKLYERLIQAERDKNEWLEKMLNDRK